MEKLKVAVIGCGSISVRHLDTASTLEDSVLVAVCDVDEHKAKAAAEKYNTKYYTDYKEMFLCEELDVVHLCLPHHIHTSVARDAFDAGINVLSEKPMSIDYEDAVKTVDMADKRGLLYGVIFQCRYNQPTQLIKKRVEDGSLGKVLAARSELTWHRPEDYYDCTDWKGYWKTEGGGVIINQAIHTLDMVNWIINDEHTEVYAHLENRCHKEREVEDTAEGLIKYKNGAVYNFYATNNYLINEPVEIRMICEKGRVKFSYTDAVITYDNGQTEIVEKSLNSLVEYSGGKAYWGTQHAVQINQFYQAVLKRECLEISGREALKTQKLICDIYKCR